MRYRTLGTIALGAAAAFAVPAAASADTADPAELFVLHGVPDTTVDVWVNGDLTLDDFEPGDVAGPSSSRPTPTPWPSLPPTPRTTPSR